MQEQTFGYIGLPRSRARRGHTQSLENDTFIPWISSMHWEITTVTGQAFTISSTEGAYYNPSLPFTHSYCKAGEFPDGTRRSPRLILGNDCTGRSRQRVPILTPR